MTETDQPAPANAVQPENTPVFSPSDDTVPAPGTTGAGVSWTASEFIAHEKSADWYMALSGATILLVAVIFLLTRDFITSGIVLFCALMFGIYAGRQPRELDYRIDSNGIHVGPKYYAFSQFRSFAVIPEDAFSSLELVPLKRFSPLLTVYYAPDREDAILSIITDRLPMEERRRDPIDSFMHRIRF